jgi:hypothetical protein
MNIRNHSISNESIVLKSGKLTGLGPAVVLRHCRVECHITARELVLTDVELHHCNFVARKQLTGYKFLEARFYDCAFEGTYSGCDFGKRAEVYDNLGDIARCDFSKARLDACRFFDGDVDSNNLSTIAPSMVVLSPGRAARSADRQGLAPRLQTFVDALAEEEDDCVALVDDLELRARRYGYELAEVHALARALGARNLPF